MKKEIKMVIDTDEARSGLFLNANYAALHKDSDEEIIEKALSHVEKFSSRFGINRAPKKELKLKPTVEKTVTVKVDTKVARTMLGLAGFNTNDKSDEELFVMAMHLLECYGVTYEEKDC